MAESYPNSEEEIVFVEEIKDVEDLTKGASIPLDLLSFCSAASKKSFMDHGLMHDPNHPHPRFPSSRDWNMPTIKCNRKDCAANYSGECIMPSLLSIGSDGKCKGYKKRVSGKKK